MRITVAIPAYNAANTIGQTLDSVLRQTVLPDEILVCNDGSMDDTIGKLREYEGAISVLSQTNEGVAGARNALCKKARGDIIAFLDQDDVWHTHYLEEQITLADRYPEAAAYFVGHANFVELIPQDWSCSVQPSQPTNLLSPREFLSLLYRKQGIFGSMSFCCVPKWSITRLGDEPFRGELPPADDLHLFSRLALLGPIAYSDRPLAAYRIRAGSFSSDRLKSLKQTTLAFSMLKIEYSNAELGLRKCVEAAAASNRRQYGKILMGNGQKREAQRQFWASVFDSADLGSISKSLSLWAIVHMPGKFQPKWPQSTRGTLEPRNRA